MSPLNTLTMIGFWVVGSNPTIHDNKLFHTLLVSNMKNILPGIYTGNETAWIYYKNISRTSAVSSTNLGSILIFASCVVDTSARTSGRRAISPFQGGGGVISLSSGKLLLGNRLQVNGQMD